MVAGKRRPDAKDEDQRRVRNTLVEAGLRINDARFELGTGFAES